MTPHARRTVRFDALWVTLFLMSLSAALTVGVLWFAFSVLLSFGTYIRSL